jgi:hypothetical protein
VLVVPLSAAEGRRLALATSVATLTRGHEQEYRPASRCLPSLPSLGASAATDRCTHNTPWNQYELLRGRPERAGHVTTASPIGARDDRW